MDYIIKVIGRAAIEAVLDISAAEVTSEKQPGKERKGVDMAYHGWQRGRVYLPDRAVRVEKPRLRNPGAGEVVIPAYEALRRPSGLGERMLAARPVGDIQFGGHDVLAALGVDDKGNKRILGLQCGTASNVI